MSGGRARRRSTTDKNGGGGTVTKDSADDVAGDSSKLGAVTRKKRPVSTAYSDRSSTRSSKAESLSSSSDSDDSTLSSDSFSDDDLHFRKSGRGRDRDSELSTLMQAENARVSRIMDILVNKERVQHQALVGGGEGEGDQEKVADKEELRRQRERLFEALRTAEQRGQEAVAANQGNANTGYGDEGKKRPDLARLTRGANQGRQKISHETIDVFGDTLGDVPDAMIQSIEAGELQLKCAPAWPSQLHDSMHARLEALRRDPSKMDKMHKRNAKFLRSRREIVPTKDLYTHNINFVSPEYQQRLREEREQVLAEKQAHRDKVKAEANRVFSAKQKRKVALSNAVQSRQERARELEEAERLLEEKRQFQKKWMVILSFAGRQHEWQTKALQLRAERSDEQAKNKAATVIQRFWRRAHGLVIGREWRRKMWLIHLTLRRWIRRFKVERERKAADTIYHFLTDIQDVTNIVSVIKRFRFHVKESQVAWRRYEVVTNAQMGVLRAQYDQVQAKIHTLAKVAIHGNSQQNLLMAKALSYDNQGIKKRKELHGQSRSTAKQAVGQIYLQEMAKDKKAASALSSMLNKSMATGLVFTAEKLKGTDANTIEVPDAYDIELWQTVVSDKIRDAALFEQLQKKRRQHSQAMATYYLQHKKWLAKEKERKELEEARRMLASPKPGRDNGSPAASKSDNLQVPESGASQTYSPAGQRARDKVKKVAGVLSAARKLSVPEAVQPIPPDPLVILMSVEEMTAIVHQTLTQTLQAAELIARGEAEQAAEDDGYESAGSAHSHASDLDSQTSDLDDLEMSLRVQNRKI